MKKAIEILKHMAGSHKHRVSDYLNGATTEMVLDAMEEYKYLNYSKCVNFIESEIKECEINKKNYGWICSHFRNYYDGRISAYEKIILFISVENSLYKPISTIEA